MKTRTETFLPLVLLVVVACGGKEPLEQASHGTETEGSELLALLPENEAVPGWSRAGEPRFFTPDSLWEYINGAADGYILYGFEEVVTADYSSESTEQQAVIDIYRMKDPTHAFGIYCQERNPDYEFLDIGAEGYVGGTALNFWQGPYYVKMMVFEESSELEGELKKLGRYVSGRIDYPGSVLREVDYFPKDNRIPHSIQFLPRDVLGQSYLSNGFEARYASGAEEYKLVAILAGGVDEAREGLAKYREFLHGGGGEPTDMEGLGEEGFLGTDRYYGMVLAARAGDRIVVALGPPSEEVGKSALRETLGNIERLQP